LTGALMSTEEIGLKPDSRGKVRDIFNLGDKLIIVATDRISAYDSILPTPIPGKGIILTQMTLGWYNVLKGKVATHYISERFDDLPEAFRGKQELDGRSMLVKKSRTFRHRMRSKGLSCRIGMEGVRKQRFGLRCAIVQ